MTSSIKMTNSIMMTSREHLNPTSSFEDLEKGKTQVTVRESESIDNANEKEDDIQWQTGFWNRFPWIGIGALIVMLICIALTGIVLGTSRDKAREEWPAYERWHWVKGSWKKKAQIDPHVLLAIINTVTNVALAIAIGQGIAIAWWRRALKGSTVEDLHRSWSFSSSVLDLLCAGRKFNLIALCALTAKLALIDNVLLQKAAGTGPGFFPEKKITTWLPIERELPAGYAGGISLGGSVGGTSAAFSWDLTDYIHDTNIDPTHVYNPDLGNSSGFDTHCNGICYPYFEGFGFKFDCTDLEESDPYPVTPDLAAQNTQNAIQIKIDALFNSTSTNGTSLDASAYEAAFNATLQKNPLLEVKSAFIPAGTRQDVIFSGLLPKAVQSKTYDRGTIGVRIQYASLTPDDDNDESKCTGTTWLRYCSLLPSVIEYPLVITNITHSDETADVSSISDSENGIQLRDVNFITPDSGESFTGNQFSGLKVKRDAYQPYDKKYDTNLQKIATFLQTNFGALVLFEYLKGNGTEGKYSPNALSELYSTSSPSLFGQWWPTYDPSNSCEIDIQDPLDSLGAALNNLMLRSSMRAATHTILVDNNWGAPNLAKNQSYVDHMYVPTVFFKTDWWFGGAAMIVIFLCVLCVLPSYYGFWELGRKVTLAPIEVSAALQAPILEHPVVATSGDVKQLVKEIGDRPIRYGEVDGEHRLGVAGPSHITSPAAHRH